MPGPRLNLKRPQQGIGPVSTVDRARHRPAARPDLLVSNSGSNNVRLLPGVGGGFFNDQNPTIFPVGNSPGPIFVGNFDGKPGLLTVNSGSNDLTLISDFTGSSAPRGPSPQGASTRWRRSSFTPATASTT